jgi:RNase P/RNase MRP subunit p30
MRTDYVFPNKNETKIIKNAELLGYKQLFLIYDFNSYKSDFKELKDKVAKLNKTTELILLLGLKVDSKNIFKAKNLTKFIFVDARDETPQAVRALLEKKPPYCIYNLEYQKHDFIHHKNSGLNQVLSNFLKENKIFLGMSFSFTLHSKYRAEILARMRQNIELARKFKFKTIVASFAETADDLRSPDDLKSLFFTLGMHPKEAEDSMNL